MPGQSLYVMNACSLFFRKGNKPYVIGIKSLTMEGPGIAGYHRDKLSYGLKTCEIGHYKISGLSYTAPCSKCPPGRY